MWLIDTTTLQLVEILNPERDSYAILSHRWRQDELTFKDIKKGCGQQKQGYRKLESLCRIAWERQLQYAWIDTCCINKDSSAELSEAINSMYRWYAEASVCIAYLDDVSCVDHRYSKTVQEKVVAWKHQEKLFRRSEWWTRGWTLQELLAPRKLDFYNSDWLSLGTRARLRKWVSMAAGIPSDALERFDCERTGTNSGPIAHVFPVAQRMSWAVDRKTTRVEDQAYSLMGLLNVNLVPLYGEGSRAFLRLQQEVLSSGDDQSLFAWSSTRPGVHGLLAPDVSCFRYSQTVTLRPLNESAAVSKTPGSFQFVNGALIIELPLQPIRNSTDLYYAFLDQTSKSLCPGKACKLVFVRTGYSEPPTFLRIVNRGIHHKTWQEEEIRAHDGLSDDFAEKRLTQLRIPEPSLLSTNLRQRRWGIANNDSRKPCPSHRITNASAIASKEGLEFEAGRCGPLALTQEDVTMNYTYRKIAYMTGIDSCLNPALTLFDNRHWAPPMSQHDFKECFGLSTPDGSVRWLEHAGEGSFWPPANWAEFLLPTPIHKGALIYGSYVIVNECQNPANSWWTITVLRNYAGKNEPSSSIRCSTSSTTCPPLSVSEYDGKGPGLCSRPLEPPYGSMDHDYPTILISDLNLGVRLQPSSMWDLCTLDCGEPTKNAAQIQVRSDWIADGSNRYYRELSVG